MLDNDTIRENILIELNNIVKAHGLFADSEVFDICLLDEAFCPNFKKPKEDEIAFCGILNSIKMNMDNEYATYLKLSKQNIYYDDKGSIYFHTLCETLKKIQEKLKEENKKKR